MSDKRPIPGPGPRVPIPIELKRELFEKRGTICEECKVKQYEHIHHIDGNPSNNNLNNLKLTCIKCHRWQHASVRKTDLTDDDMLDVFRYTTLDDLIDNCGDEWMYECLQRITLIENPDTRLNITKLFNHIRIAADNRSLELMNLDTALNFQW